MTERRPTLAGYDEVLVLQQDGCGLCSRWILCWRSMVYTTCWVEELSQNQPTAKITQFNQQTTATICSTGEYSWYELSKDYWSGQSARSGKVRQNIIEQDFSCFSYVSLLLFVWWLPLKGFLSVIDRQGGLLWLLRVWVVGWCIHTSLWLVI